MAHGDNECVAVFDEADEFSAEATAGVTGCRALAISANAEGSAAWPGLSTTTDGNNVKVAHCGAGLRPIGVSSYDAGTGEKLKVIAEGIVPIKAGAGVSAGNEVEVGTSGQVIPKSMGIAFGVAVADAANGANCYVKLY